MLKRLSLSPEREGEILILLEAAIWGLFPIISTLTFKNLGPILTAGLSLSCSLLFLVPLLIKKGLIVELSNRAAWRPILLATFFLGILFYFLVFVGTSLSTPGNVSILLLLEVLTTIVYFQFRGIERLNLQERLGALLIVVSALIVLFPEGFRLNPGDILILLAVCVAPVGNYFSKLARAEIGSIAILTIRNALSAVVLVLFGLSFEGVPQAAQIANSAATLLLNGILILAISKILWIEGIFRIPVSKAIGLSSIFPVVTLIASHVCLGLEPSRFQIFALVPALLGVYLVTSVEKV